jgi:hypothetical protein
MQLAYKALFTHRITTLAALVRVNIPLKEKHVLHKRLLFILSKLNVN